MRFSSRPEVCFNPKVYLQRSTLKPTTSTVGQIRRLRYFGNTEHTFIKGAGFAFPALRHCKLNMIKRGDSHGTFYTRTADRNNSRYSPGPTLCSANQLALTAPRSTNFSDLRPRK